jgi:hypothetical protein
MGEWKVQVSFRVRGDLRAEMIQFAETERRSLGNLGAILLEWSFERLKAAGCTSKLFGRSRGRLNEITRDKR